MPCYLSYCWTQNTGALSKRTLNIVNNLGVSSRYFLVLFLLVSLPGFISLQGKKEVNVINPNKVSAKSQMTEEEYEERKLAEEERRKRALDKEGGGGSAKDVSSAGTSTKGQKKDAGDTTKFDVYVRILLLGDRCSQCFSLSVPFPIPSQLTHVITYIVESARRVQC